MIRTLKRGGHGINFDAAVLGAEFLRAKLANPLTSRKQICTMLSTTNFCRLPGSRGYKWPKLIEFIKEVACVIDDTRIVPADVRRQRLFELRGWE